MALSECSNGLVFTAVVATVLLVPVPYFDDDYPFPGEAAGAEFPESARRTPTPDAARAWPSLDVPSANLTLAASLALSVVLVYICDWIQRKLMERRILKLNQWLGQSLDRARGWHAAQRRLQRALLIVRCGAAEFQLTLHLLLRQHRYNKDINGLIYINNPV